MAYHFLIRCSDDKGECYDIIPIGDWSHQWCFSDVIHHGFVDDITARTIDRYQPLHVADKRLVGAPADFCSDNKSRGLLEYLNIVRCVNRNKIIFHSLDTESRSSHFISICFSPTRYFVRNRFLSCWIPAAIFFFMIFFMIVFKCPWGLDSLFKLQQLSHEIEIWWYNWSACFDKFVRLNHGHRKPFN